jgi:hypothetical protein
VRARGSAEFRRKEATNTAAAETAGCTT